ncbi:Lead, cadmium, zinc and mercury-transporting ATPase [Psychrobacter pasteurii]|uniref:P-type Zn(2+) transporter n=1 Tax=Psychrobacter pasteurii TaxID=1945520 RepID=A0A1R4EHH2_9GAMM|nr:heavy metal translocating P-type ATPase [Psychrobacter pasteurii]SJM37938.1 Lead, cadmium, zinc and mercury-transporting ATPase [Psychrobacter pasteurii]
MQYHVDGMDCASCVGKIESALSRMSGVSDVQLNFATRKLDLTLDPESKTTAKDVEKTIKSLGFDITEVSESHDASNMTDDSLEAQHWWQSKKGKQVVVLGTLMSAAYVFSLIFPSYGTWVFALAVIIGVTPFARTAWALARTGTPFSIEMLMSVAAIGALIIGEAEEAAAVVFLFSVGELFESVAADRARAGIKALTNLIPKNAIRIDPEGKHHEVAASSLKVNDLILIRPGDRVSADGEITQGESSIDDSPITGESVPIHKAVGDTVFAGSVNLDGVIQVKVEKAAKDNTISRIIELVEQAQASKAPTARFIEKFSQYYTPIVMGIAALIIIAPPLFMGGEWMTWLYRGLALLLIACPCALVLSTPAAIASGLAVGARRGLLIKGGSALEVIGQVDTIAFDKTGTLTEGEPKVTNVVGLTERYLSTEGERELLGLFAAVEYGSSHPLAKAIVDHAEAFNVAIPAASNSYATAGKAVHATVNQRTLAIGSPVYAANETVIAASQQAQIETLQNEGKTVSVLIDEGSHEVLGLVALRDELRADSKAAIAELKTLGIRSVMLTGDNKLTAKALASDLQVDWEAELLPEDKLNLLSRMRSNNKIAMVGDGINDAPALATADVGIAMGGGTDVAMETADIALLKSRVIDVVHLIKLSRATMRNIHQNVVFALGLKGVFLITTILGITGLWIAVLADTGATVLVTLNALRLLRFKGSDE